MLANLVAEKYTSIYDVDWVQMARSINQSISQSNVKCCRSAKEFSGHTYTSLRSIYMSRLVRNAKMKQKVETVTPMQVIITEGISTSFLYKVQAHSECPEF